jgi:uncharacterized OsmC-like protein
MDKNEPARVKAERFRKYLEYFEKNPEAAKLKLKVSACVKDNMVILRAGRFTWEEDLPPVLGGENAAPGPVHHMLGALAGCSAALLKNYLAPMTETQVDSIEVDVQCELDLRGIYGMTNASAELRNVSSLATIRSNDDPEKIRNMFELWKQRAPVFLCFEKPVPVSARLVVERK